MVKVALISALSSLLFTSSSGKSYVRRRLINGQSLADRSDGSMVLQLGNEEEGNVDPTTITLHPFTPNDGAGSNKVTDFFSNDEGIMYSFEFVDNEDFIKIHRVPAAASSDKTTMYSRKLLEIEEGESDGEENATSVAVLTNIFLVLLCIITAANAAGLTMGLLSLDPIMLEIKRRTSTSTEERQWSTTLLPLLLGHSKRHKLMVTLLLVNAIANEALPLFLDELLPGKYASILVSVTLVLFFGEIVPSAFFTGPNQVEVSAKLVPVVKVVMAILHPIASPIAKLLDHVLHNDDEVGDTEDDVTEGNYFNRGELGALVRIQYEAQLADHRRRKQASQKLVRTLTPILAAPLRDHSNISTQSNTDSSQSHTHHSIREIAKEMTLTKPGPKKTLAIHEDEITMIEGALAMTVKVAADVCTPLRRVYALPMDTVLDEETCVSIWSRGFSRIPIYDNTTTTGEDALDSATNDGGDDISGIVGVLLSRQLIVMSPNDERRLDTVPLVLPPCISVSMHLVDLINMFQAAGGRGKGGLHLAIVCARPEIASEALERGESIPKEAGVVGIVTLEDVVEELLQEEIYDEVDRDLELSQWAVSKWKKFVKRKRLARSKAVAAVTEATPLIS